MDPLIAFAESLLRFLKARNFDDDPASDPDIAELQEKYRDLNLTQRQQVLDFMYSNMHVHPDLTDDNQSEARRYLRQADMGEVDNETEILIRPCSQDYIESLLLIYQNAQTLSLLTESCINLPPRNPKWREFTEEEEGQFYNAILEYPILGSTLVNTFCKPLSRVFESSCEPDRVVANVSMPEALSIMETASSSAQASLSGIRRKTYINGSSTEAQEFSRDLSCALSMRLAAEEELINKINEAEERELSPDCPECLELEEYAKEALSLFWTNLVRLAMTPSLIPDQAAFWTRINLLSSDSCQTKFCGAMKKLVDQKVCQDICHEMHRSHSGDDRRPWEQFLLNGAPGIPSSIPFMTPGLISQIIPASGMRLIRWHKEEYLEFRRYIRERNAVVLERVLNNHIGFPPAVSKNIPDWCLKPKLNELSAIIPNPFPRQVAYNEFSDAFPAYVENFNIFHKYLDRMDGEQDAPRLQDSTRFAIVKIKMRAQSTTHETFEQGENEFTDPY